MFFRKHGSHSHSHNHQEEDHTDKETKEAKVNELKAAVGPLHGHDQIYCSEACFRRYLEARNWNVEKAKKMLLDSLEWRSTFKPEGIRWPDVSLESETGKLYRANFEDREGRTVIVMTPAKQNTSSHDGQLRQLVYMLENAVLNLPEGQEQMVWLIDFTGWTLAQSTPVKTVRETANILQNHYPERLAIAFLFNPPRIFEAFWKVVKVFLDQKTYQKVNFVYSKNDESIKLMHKFFNPEVLPVQFGGKNSMQYDHQEYSRMMLKDDIKTAGFWNVHQTVDS